MLEDSSDQSPQKLLPRGADISVGKDKQNKYKSQLGRQLYCLREKWGSELNRLCQWGDMSEGDGGQDGIWSYILNKVAREDTADKVTLELRHVAPWPKTVSGKENTKCHNPEVGGHEGSQCAHRSRGREAVVQNIWHPEQFILYTSSFIWCFPICEMKWITTPARK